MPRPAAHRRRIRRSKPTSGLPSGLPSTTGPPPSWRRRRPRPGRRSEAENPAVWRPCARKESSGGAGPRARSRSSTPGQGSQYVNMLRALRETEPVVRDTFAEADRVMTPLLGHPLSATTSSWTPDDPAEVAARRRGPEADRDHPARRPRRRRRAHAASSAPTASHPDMVMGHSLGEYGALGGGRRRCPSRTPCGRCRARGREMTRVSVDDNGKMAAVFAPHRRRSRRCWPASTATWSSRTTTAVRQAVIGGASAAVRGGGRRLHEAPTIQAVLLPVSHAFHTRIVAPASRAACAGPSNACTSSRRSSRWSRTSPASFYPMDPGARPRVLEMLGRQVASPGAVREGSPDAARGRGDALRRGGAQEGPPRLRGRRARRRSRRWSSLFTNHPKLADAVAFNQALCGLYAAGLGRRRRKPCRRHAPVDVGALEPVGRRPTPRRGAPASARGPSRRALPGAGPRLRRVPGARPLRSTREPARGSRPGADPRAGGHHRVRPRPARPAPGLRRLERGPHPARRAVHRRGAEPAAPRGMADKHIVRLVKSDAGRVPLRADRRRGRRDQARRRGAAPWTSSRSSASPPSASPPSTSSPSLAIGAGLDALRDAGIPLVMRYKTTTRGTSLPDRWSCCRSALRDDTGVIFASAFPGLDSFAEELTRYHEDRGRRERLAAAARPATGSARRGRRLPSWPTSTRGSRRPRPLLEQDAFVFDRRFLFRVLSMGHSQFAEHIGARGPNTQVNAACASTTQAMALAEDWIRAGRCRRVIVVAGRRRHLGPPAGVDRRRLPGLGRGRHRRAWWRRRPCPSTAAATGMIVGMGAAALVVESAEAARERGLRADLRGPLHGHRQQRLPRHAPRRPPHRRGHGDSRRPGGVALRRQARRDGPRDRLRLSRDLHPGARGQRLGRGARAAERLRGRRRPDRDGQHQGLHRAPHGAWGSRTWWR